MAKKSTFKERVQGRRQSKNVEDIRPAQRKAKAQSEKDLMDIYMPHNPNARVKDLKRTKPDDSTTLVNTISSNDGSRASRLKNKNHKDPKPQKLSKKK